MPLKLVLGPANSAKAGEVLGAFSAVAARGAVLVVPTAEDQLHYRRELAGPGTVLGAVVTFNGLGHEIARRVGYAGRRLSAAQRAGMLRSALAGAELPLLGRSAAGLGFRRAAGELIAELERDLVSPQRFTSALRSWAQGDPGRTAYAEEVGRIYQGYARECDRRGWVDGELFAWRALDALRAAPGRWGREAVFFYGFDDLTRLQRDAVETLSRLVGVEVTVSLNYEAGRPALEARAEAVTELTALAETVLELPPSDEHYAPAQRGVLHHLERQLFQGDPERIDPGDAISLLEAGGARAEVELVAGAILDLLRDGVPGGEIAVVYRSLAGVAPLVARVFAEYGIPLAADYELPFAHTTLGRAVRGAARAALAPEAGAADLLTYLRAPGLLERPESADELEAELRRAGATGMQAARDRLGWRLEELDALRDAADPGPELCRLARRLLASPRRGAAAVLSPAQTLDARALAVLERAIGELAELGQLSGPAELLELLEELRVRAPGAETPNGGEIRLAEPLQIRARRFRAVFVCALQEGEFPAPARPEPFLSDERRHELALASGLRLSRREDVLGFARERYLLYATVSRATERLILSYRSSDEEGNLAVASPFIADVAEVLDPGWPERRARRLLTDVVWTADRAPTAREQARAQAARVAPAGGDEPEPDRHLTAVALGRLRHSQILSAGALEAYSDCPVRWLIERELRPAPLEPDSEAIVRGNLMHAVLERLLEELDGPLDSQSLDHAQAILTHLLAELATGPGATLGAGAPGVVRAGALHAIEADLRRYLRHDAARGGDWRPFGLELRFGFEDDEGGGRPSLPPLALGTDSERVLVRGMIDRIDIDPGGRAVVRDYKSGNVRPDWPVARWGPDRRLQVALYLVVVRELTALHPVGGFYQPLRGDDLRPRGLFDRDAVGDAGAVDAMDRDGRAAQEFTAELDDAVTRATAVATELRSGALEPCPQTCSRDGCAYPGICRSQ